MQAIVISGLHETGSNDRLGIGDDALGGGGGGGGVGGGCSDSPHALSDPSSCWGWKPTGKV